MLHFIVSNAATILISLALAAAILAIVGRGIQKLRHGAGFCDACGACARGRKGKD
jgi:hypothetical protein